MRISDWSSDVCSSDLGGYGGAVGPAGERGGNMFDRLGRLASASHLLGNRISRRLDEIRRRPGRHKVVLRQSSILSSRLTIEAIEPRLLLSEIGRASCRARVCLYV